ncbi:MAG: hypothetical protein JST00_31695 [Deltaproteobacteria bacterium]|nr:hypothetical protein [Deltaproteobacteria bacterium]
MAELKIRVVAVADRSLAVAYRPLVEAAERTRRQLGAIGQTTTRQAARDADAHVRAYDRAERTKVVGAERAAALMARIRERSATMAGQYAAREAAAAIRAQEKATRERMRENDRYLRDVERTEAAAARAAERGAAARVRAEERALSASKRDSERSRSRLASAVISGVGAAGRAGLAITKELARGAGVQLDLGSHIKAGVDLEKAAVDLSNAGYMPGKAGPAGIRQDARAIEADVRKAAIATGSDSGDAMEGLQAFVGKTGDLETGRNLLADLAKLSKATGSNLSDMTNAAGDVANALGDVPDKAGAIREVMQAVAAQGKEGAVEIKDLASQMAKVGAAASTFTGNRGEVVAQMAALAQMTRAKGGAASATQAATSVSSFANTFSKGARLDALQRFGVDFKGADGRVDVRKAIFGAIQSAGHASHGGMESFDRNMGQMFMDVRARSVTKGFETIYKENGGGEAGLKAAMKAFDDLSSSVMKNKEVEDSFAAAMQTTDAKAKQFNEQLGAAVNEIRAGLLPVLKDLAPTIVSGTKTIADWIAKLTGRTKAEEDTTNINAELGAQRTRIDLEASLAKGELAPGQTEGAASARAALAAAIERKKKDVEKEGNTSYATAPGAMAPVKKLSEMNEKELSYAASLTGSGVDDGDRARQYLRDKQQLGRMTENLDQLEGVFGRAMQRVVEGGLKVTVTNADEIGGRPSIDWNSVNHGRQAPIGPHDAPGAPRMRGPGK